MGIFGKISNFLDSDETKSKKSHLKNMLAIAMADGNLENEEHNFIISKAQEMYMTHEQIMSVINNPEDVTFYIPKTDKERIDQLYDLVCVSVIDGNVNKREISLCKLCATQFGFRPQIIDKIINSIIEGILKGIVMDKIIKGVLKEI